MTAAFAGNNTIGVLLLGATGSLGSRIPSALLERPFIKVTAVVRSRDKLKEALLHHQDSALPPLEGRLYIIKGNATNSNLLA